MKDNQEYISIPKKEYEKLTKEVSELKLLVNEMLDRSIKTLEEVDSLKKTIKEQQEIINNFKGNKLPKKNSSNSNIPPSKDLYRIDNRRSLRKKSNRKSGGQLGHKGHHLEFSQHPDKKIDLYSNQCTNCGIVLKFADAVFREARQVIDLPPLNTITYQYNSYDTPCKCGCINKPVFPEHVNASVQYGPKIRALTNYLSVRHFIPFKRLTEIFNDCFDAKISQGFIANTLARSAQKAIGIYNHIKDQIQYSKWLGADETLIFVNGKKNTLWTWQNEKYTFLSTTNSRHAKHIDRLFYHGFPDAIISSDQYAPHLNTYAKGHQICWVHLLRKIAFLSEVQNHYWLNKIKLVYKKAIQLKKLNSNYNKKSNYTKSIENELNNLLLRKLNKKTHPLIAKFQKSLRKNRPFLLTFLYQANVPPDNNSSEQAIRNAKVKIKISGGFKSLQHAYSVTRSVIDTAIKNNCNILNIITDIEAGQDISFVRPE